MCGRLCAKFNAGTKVQNWNSEFWPNLAFLLEQQINLS